MSATVPSQTSTSRSSGQTQPTTSSDSGNADPRKIASRPSSHNQAIKANERGQYAFTENMRKLFKSDRGDVTIIGKDRSWKVHSDIVATHCEFLRAACDGPFKEAHTHSVQMIYDDSSALDSLLEYLYTGTYTEICSITVNEITKRRQDVEWNDILKKHAEVFTLADKYGVATLKKLAGAAIHIASIELSIRAFA